MKVFPFFSWSWEIYDKCWYKSIVSDRKCDDDSTEREFKWGNRREKKNISLAVSGLKKPAFGVTVYLIRDDDDDGKVVVGGRGWGAWAWLANGFICPWYATMSSSSSSVRWILNGLRVACVTVQKVGGWPSSLFFIFLVPVVVIWYLHAVSRRSGITCTCCFFFVCPREKEKRGFWFRPFAWSILRDRFSFSKTRRGVWIGR